MNGMIYEDYEMFAPPPKHSTLLGVRTTECCKAGSIEELLMRMNVSTDRHGSVNRVQRSVKSQGLFAVRVLEGRGAAVSRGSRS